jgi:hypothetical protein
MLYKMSVEHAKMNTNRPCVLQETFKTIKWD